MDKAIKRSNDQMYKWGYNRLQWWVVKTGVSIGRKSSKGDHTEVNTEKKHEIGISLEIKPNYFLYSYTSFGLVVTSNKYSKYNQNTTGFPVTIFPMHTYFMVRRSNVTYPLCYTIQTCSWYFMDFKIKILPWCSN